MSELFDPLFGADRAARLTGDRAWVEALFAVEAALARAAARCGIADAGAAERVAAAAGQLADIDPAELGRAAVAGGNPVIPLVARLRELVAVDDAAAVHPGATSQDVLDTAAMLLARQVASHTVATLRACAELAAHLAATHRDTPMIGRTLLQRAVPTTFGAVAIGWTAGLDAAAAALTRLHYPVQLGGAAGTLAALHPHGLRMRSALAVELHLDDPGRTWHADRTPVAELAAALGVTAAAVGKVALDVVLLVQTEVGELREAAPGGSSAMAHKQNPIAAITARAAAAQCPGLVATVLAAVPELQRGAGPWHAEWPALTALLSYSAGAAERLRTSLAGLRVDTDAMVAHLDEPTPDLGHAGDLVDSYLAGRTRHAERT